MIARVRMQSPRLLIGRGDWAVLKFEFSQRQTALEANRWLTGCPINGSRLRQKDAVDGRSEAPRP